MLYIFYRVLHKCMYSIQDVFKQSTVSHVCPSSETYTASAVWCGIGHQEFDQPDHDCGAAGSATGWGHEPGADRLHAGSTEAVC